MDGTGLPAFRPRTVMSKTRLISQTRRPFFTADCAEEQAKLQEKVVAEIDKLFPDQTNRTHDLKQYLLGNIDAQKRISYRVRTGAIAGM